MFSERQFKITYSQGARDRPAGNKGLGTKNRFCIHAHEASHRDERSVSKHHAVLSFLCESAAPQEGKSLFPLLIVYGCFGERMADLLLHPVVLRDHLPIFAGPNVHMTVSEFRQGDPIVLTAAWHSIPVLISFK